MQTHFPNSPLDRRELSRAESQKGTWYLLRMRIDQQGMWQGLPYYPIAQYYRSRFGEKVYKIPVAVAETCPNRMGINGMKTCIFCDEWGSSANHHIQEKPLLEQIHSVREMLQKKMHANKFLVYFQAYTNTFVKFSRLKENLNTAVNVPGVVGLVIGTRPDCISKAVIGLWNEMAEKTFFAVELGVQSFNNDSLKFFERGHTTEQSIEAIHRIAREAPKVNLGIHLIFGSPYETNEEIIETAKLCNTLPIQNVKLHNLHVLKNTPLADLYNQGKFQPLDLPTYTEKVSLFLQHLSPEIAVHRLAAYAPRWDELIAPEWTKQKMRTYQYMLDTIKIPQGSAYQSVV